MVQAQENQREEHSLQKEQLVKKLLEWNKVDVSRSIKSGHHGSEAAGKRESGRGDTAEEARTRSLRASETWMN